MKKYIYSNIQNIIEGFKCGLTWVSIMLRDANLLDIYICDHYFSFSLGLTISKSRKTALGCTKDT